MSLSITPTSSPFSLHSPSTSLYIPLSVWQHPSGIWGTLSGPQHSPPLGPRENLLHRQVKGTPCSGQRVLQRLKEETDWQKSGGCSIFLHSPLQSLFHPPPPLAHGWPACGWGREEEGDWEQEIKSLYGLCIKLTLYPEQTSISLLHFSISSSILPLLYHFLPSTHLVPVKYPSWAQMNNCWDSVSWLMRSRTYSKPTCVFLKTARFTISQILKPPVLNRRFIIRARGRSRAHWAALLFGRVNDLRQIFKPKVRASRLGGKSGDNWCVISSWINILLCFSSALF